MSDHQTILLAFFDRLRDFDWSPDVPVLYPGLNEKPPSEGLWLEAGYFPNRPRDDTWNDTCALFVGFAQALIGFRPGDGLETPYELADALVDWFPKSQPIGPLRVLEAPTVAPHFVDDGNKLFIPVTIRLTGFTE